MRWLDSRQFSIIDKDNLLIAKAEFMMHVIVFV